MFPALKFWMLIKFDFSPKTGILVVKFAFATANLKIETLRMCRRFARVLENRMCPEPFDLVPRPRRLRDEERAMGTRRRHHCVWFLGRRHQQLPPQTP